MAWTEKRGQQYRVYERVEGKRAFVPFATEDLAADFRKLVAVIGWEKACAFVRGQEEPTPVAEEAGDNEPSADPEPRAVVPAGAPEGLRPAGLTVGGVCRMYVRAQAHEVDEGTITQYKSYIRMHIDPYFGDLDAGYITRDPMTRGVKSVSAWHAWLKKQDVLTRTGKATGRKLSNKTCMNIHGLVSAAYRQALEADVAPVVDRNPFALRPVKKGARKETRVFLDDTQLAALLAVMDGDYALLVEFLAKTGLRWGEAAGLTVRHLHLAPRTGEPRLEVVTALKHNAKSTGGGVTLGRLKSEASHRVLTVPASLVPRLATLVTGKSADDLVFTTVTGQPLRHSHFVDRELKPAIEATGGLVPDRLRPHDLRHTCAAWLLRSGRTMYQVARQLGHEDSRTTEKHYAHLQRSEFIANAACLDTLTGHAAPVPPAPGAPAATGGELAEVIDLRVRLQAADEALPEVSPDVDEDDQESA